MSGMEALDVDYRGLTLRGMLHLPEDLPAPVVVVCHGFSGSRMDMNGAYVKLARRLAGRGVATYRFDFSGCGESDGEFEDFTVSDRMAQVVTVMNGLERHSGISADRISLLGMSMGALVAVLVSGARPVRSLVMWAPAGGGAQTEYWARHRVWELLEKQGRIDMGGAPLTRRYFEDVQNLDQFSAAERHGGPVLLAGGADDGLMAPELTDPYRRVWGDRLEELEFEGVGHSFEDFEARARLMDATEEFFTRYS